MLLHLLQICSLSLSVLFCQSSTWPSSLSTFSFPLIIHPYISSPCSLTGALPLSIYCHCFEMMPNCQCFKYFLPTSLGPLQQHPHFIFFPQKIILGRKFYERKKMFSCSCMCFSLVDHIFQWCCNKKKWLSLMYKVQRVVLYAARCIFLPTFNLNFPSHDLKLLHSSCHLTLTRGVWFYHLTTRKANHKPLLSAWPPLHHTQQALLSPEVLCPNSPSW